MSSFIQVKRSPTTRASKRAELCPSGDLRISAYFMMRHSLGVRCRVDCRFQILTSVNVLGLAG